MIFIALIPALLGLFFIAFSIYLMRIEHIFAKKETVLTQARRISPESNMHAIYQFQAGGQTFTFDVRPRGSFAVLPPTYPVRYLAANPEKYEVYLRPFTNTPAHRRFNWFKCIILQLGGILLLYGAALLAFS